MEVLKLIIGGDFVPTKLNEDIMENENFIQKLDERFREIWLKADFRIFNLECALCKEKKTMIKKNGPHVIGKEETIRGIKSLNPSIICLANNHILDGGIEGLKNTMNLLNRYDIQHTGIVQNERDRLRDCVIERNNVKIGVYNVCENEFSTATDIEMGTNGLDEVKNCKEIMELKRKVDYLLVIFHGGKEHYRYVSPNCQRICRNFVDFGADIVITQHTHCIGCKEEYNNATIIYGQGDFLFNSSNKESRRTGLLIEIDFNEKSYTINYIPIERKENLFKISENSKILRDFFLRSEEIKNKEVLLKKYNEFSNDKINSYLKAISGNKLIYKIIDKLCKNEYFLNYYYNEKCLLQLLNYIECEAHRELLKQGLVNKLFHDSKK